MIYAYIGRNRKLCLRPADPEGEQELRDFLKDLKQLGLEAIDVETEMPEDQYRDYQHQKQRYGYDQGRQQAFGFQPRSYMPQPPDFSPQAHFPLWPFVLPFILEGQGGGSGGGGSGGGTSNYRRGGDYDGSDRGNENPRDTGRGDIPRR